MEYGLGRVLLDRSGGRKRSSPRASRFTFSGYSRLSWRSYRCVDASITIFAPGTRRHIQTALKFGATIEEIMEVQDCVAQGFQASNLGIPILVEELQRAQQLAKEGKK
jgi:hypothetical protein